MQIAEKLENAILTGAYEEETQIPSITEFSVAYCINPATALKGVNILTDEGLIYKKRGLGMFVATGAKEKILTRRQKQFKQDFIVPMMDEARRLSITPDDIMKIIREDDEYGDRT